MSKDLMTYVLTTNKKRLVQMHRKIILHKKKSKIHVFFFYLFIFFGWWSSKLRMQWGVVLEFENCSFLQKRKGVKYKRTRKGNRVYRKWSYSSRVHGNRQGSLNSTNILYVLCVCDRVCVCVFNVIYFINLIVEMALPAQHNHWPANYLWIQE